MKFKIIANPSKEWAGKVAKEVEAFLKAKKQEIAKEGEDIAVLIGGDGTIFYNKGCFSGAVFAIGGKQSMVCQAKEGNWKPMLEKTIKKPRIEERTALSVKVNGKEVGWAINDAVVHARRHNFVEITVKAQGQVHEFGGDGVIVATPTGASGYAYSAGGFIVEPSNFLLEIVPICPYMRKFRATLAPVASEIEISAKGAADLVLDGQKIIELEERDTVQVNGNRIVRFVKV